MNKYQVIFTVIAYILATALAFSAIPLADFYKTNAVLSVLGVTHLVVLCLWVMGTALGVVIGIGRLIGKVYDKLGEFK